MARISTYALDAKPDLDDKVLGTDTNPEAGMITKNYSLREMVEMFNQKNAVAVAGQSIFRFQYDDLTISTYERETGTISFQDGLGVGTNFSAIGQLYISIKNSGNKRILELLQTMVKSRIILCQSDDVNNFGVYFLDSLVQDGISDFYIATLAPDLEMVNGALKKDKHYAIAEYFRGDAFEIHNQTQLSDEWSVAHSLDKKPSVTVVDAGDTKIVGKVEYIDNNNLTIKLNTPHIGKAYLN